MVRSGIQQLPLLCNTATAGEPGASSGHFARMLASSTSLASLSAALVAALSLPAHAQNCAQESDGSKYYRCEGEGYFYTIDADSLDDDVEIILFEDIDDTDNVIAYFFEVLNVGSEGSGHGDDGESVDKLQVSMFADTNLSYD